MPTGVHTQNERGCRGYDPWRMYGSKFREFKPLNPEAKIKTKIKANLWNRYLAQTQELRSAMMRGSITPEQFDEATKPFLREYAEAMTMLTGIPAKAV